VKPHAPVLLEKSLDLLGFVSISTSFPATTSSLAQTPNSQFWGFMAAAIRSQTMKPWNFTT
jgi:hypothetical protein